MQCGCWCLKCVSYTSSFCASSAVSAAALYQLLGQQIPNRRCLNITFITHRFSLALLISDHSVSTEALDKPKMICSPFFPSFPQSKVKFPMWVLSWNVMNYSHICVIIFYIETLYSMILETYFCLSYFTQDKTVLNDYCFKYIYH